MTTPGINVPPVGTQKALKKWTRALRSGELNKLKGKILGMTAMR